MAVYKFTMLIQQSTTPVGSGASVRTGGWSESVYSESLGPLTRASFLRFCQARAGILPTNAAVVGQRYQQVNPVGGSSTDSQRYPGVQFNPLTVGSEGGDVPQMALLCRTSTQFANVRPTVLRGLPDFVVRGGEYWPVQVFDTALTAYFLELTGWRMMGRNLAAPAIPVFRVSAAGLVSFWDNTAVVVPGRLRITSSVDANGDRRGGTFKALSQPTASSVQLEGWDWGLTDGGSAKSQNLLAILMTTSRVSRVIVRKVGRPFFGYVGRRSNKRR